jgi:hypothetical protein
MAWAWLVFYPGGTDDQYRAVTDEIGDALENADGRTYFAAGPTDGAGSCSRSGHGRSTSSG